MAASFCRRSFLNYKNCLFQTQKRTGYVVLIPETSKEIAEYDIISLENLPDFSKLDRDTCKQIFNKHSQQYDIGAWELDEHLKKQIKEAKEIDVVKHIIEPLEVLTVPFGFSLGIANTFYVANRDIMPFKSFYAISDRVSQVISSKYNIQSIYNIYKKELETASENYTEEQRRILNKFIWEGFLNGFDLSEEKKIHLNKCYSTINYKKRVYDEKMKNSKILFKQLIEDENFAKKSPLDFLRNTAVNLEKPLDGPWVITLKDAIYHRFLEYCDSRDARRHIWISYNQLCSHKANSPLNASSDVEEIRRRRRLCAQTLGFPSYVHLSLKTKMAESIENVQSVLSSLLEPAKYAQEKEIYELEKFAYEHDFKGTLELWDLPYWTRMEKKHKFGLDELTLKDYFPLSQVLLGLFALCEQLFSIEIEEQDSVLAWDPDVRYFRISDAKTKAILGGFYLDPYARVGKMIGENNNGWFVPMRPRSKICTSLPLSSLIFSFTPPTEEKPSLLYYREIEHLFEKFGHVLQFTLTEMNYSEVSGTSNIEWDAINICSNFLKFWLCEKGTVESISGHYDTGEPLPSHLLDNLCSIHKHMAGTKLCRHIYLSNLDLELHLQEDSCMTIAEKLWPEHLLFELNRLDCHPYGFKEIFISPWGSSFYSHIWSKMVAADAFSAFVEVGLNNQEEISTLGKRFRSTFLSLGGGCNPKEVFLRFRGREPNPKLLAGLLNLKNPPSAPAPDLAPSDAKLVVA